MASPFPGMDPYLEQPDVWHEFHESLCSAILAHLAGRLPDPYFVRGDATIYVKDDDGGERRLGRPDGFIGGVARTNEMTAATAVLPAPATTVLPDPDSYTETTIEIHDSRRRRVVTAIEVLSPSNKDPNDDYRRYAAKPLAYLRAGVSLVEIDLLRGGERPRTLRPLPPCDYVVLVARAADHPSAGVWPIQLRDRLPEIPVPLSPPDADVTIDLQAMMTAAYDSRSFRKFIYDGEPSPALGGEDAVWAKGVAGARN